MGEITELLFDGTLCIDCGGFVEEKEEVGYVVDYVFDITQSSTQIGQQCNLCKGVEIMGTTYEEMWANAPEEVVKNLWS